MEKNNQRTQRRTSTNTSHYQPSLSTEESPTESSPSKNYFEESSPSKKIDFSLLSESAAASSNNHLLISTRQTKVVGTIASNREESPEPPQQQQKERVHTENLKTEYTFNGHVCELEFGKPVRLLPFIKNKNKKSRYGVGVIGTGTGSNLRKNSNNSINNNNEHSKNHNDNSINESQGKPQHQRQERVTELLERRNYEPKNSMEKLSEQMLTNIKNINDSGVTKICSLKNISIGNVSEFVGGHREKPESLPAPAHVHLPVRTPVHTPLHTPAHQPHQSQSSTKITTRSRLERQQRKSSRQELYLSMEKHYLGEQTKECKPQENIINQKTEENEIEGESTSKNQFLPKILKNNNNHNSRHSHSNNLLLLRERERERERDQDRSSSLLIPESEISSIERIRSEQEIIICGDQNNEANRSSIEDNNGNNAALMNTTDMSTTDVNANMTSTIAAMTTTTTAMNKTNKNNKRYNNHFHHFGRRSNAMMKMMMTSSSSNINLHHDEQLEGYNIGPVIGRGTYSTVRLAKNCQRKKFAVKIYPKATKAGVASGVDSNKNINISNKNATNDNRQINLDREIEILYEIDHPGLLKFYETIYTEKNVYLVTELLSNISMAEYVNKGLWLGKERRKEGENRQEQGNMQGTGMARGRRLSEAILDERRRTKKSNKSKEEKEVSIKNRNNNHKLRQLLVTEESEEEEQYEQQDTKDRNKQYSEQKDLQETREERASIDSGALIDGNNIIYEESIKAEEEQDGGDDNGDKDDEKPPEEQIQTKNSIKVRKKAHKISRNPIIANEQQNTILANTSKKRQPQHSRRRLPEHILRPIMRSIFEAFVYLHGKDIVHRDIKMENILIVVNNKLGGGGSGGVRQNDMPEKSTMTQIEKSSLTDKVQPATTVTKIIDFGFSIKLTHKGQVLDDFCGTPHYISPEVARKKGYYGKSADIWSLGVLLYRVGVGEFPFEGTSEKSLFAKIMKGEYRMPEIKKERRKKKQKGENRENREKGQNREKGEKGNDKNERNQYDDNTTSEYEEQYENDFDQEEKSPSASSSLESSSSSSESSLTSYKEFRISRELADLIKSILQVDWEKRPQIGELLKHKWFANNTSRIIIKD